MGAIGSGENGTGEFRRREIRDPKEIRKPKTEEVSGIQVHYSKDPEHPSGADVPPFPGNFVANLVANLVEFLMEKLRYFDKVQNS
jgi:hypothetical protein